MKGWFFIIISILLIPLVFAADNPSQDERYNNILEKLKRGEIDTESIRIISQGIPSENQEAFIGTIGGLKEGKEKVFWESFWKLPYKDRTNFINSFETTSKNDLLNIFSNQYFKPTEWWNKRKNPILKFNLEGDVDVRLIKTPKGQKYLAFGDKFIFLESFKKESRSENEPYKINYNGETDTIVKTHGKNTFSIKGGNILLGQDAFYVYDSDNKLDKSHELYGMRNIEGNIALDLTGDEYKMSINSYGEEGKKHFSSVGLKNGMKISSIKESDKVAEIIFDKEGKIKVLKNLKTSLTLGSQRFGYETINGKMRFISDVEGFLDNNGKIDSGRMREFMLEGGKESKYDGYFVFDKEGGENGKPFIAAVAEGVGIREFGRLTNEALQIKKLDTIGKLFAVDTQEQKTGSMLSSLNIEQLEKIEKHIKLLKTGTSDIGEAVTGTIDLVGSFFGGKKKISARANIDEALKPLLGDDYKMTDIDYEIFSNTEFLNSVQNAVNHFKTRLKENPGYFKEDNERFKLGEGIASQTREDFDALIGVIGKIDSIYDAIIPKSTVILRGDVGTLVVGGNVEVFNDDLKITENLNGVSFGAGIISEGDRMTINLGEKLLGSPDDDGIYTYQAPEATELYYKFNKKTENWEWSPDKDVWMSTSTTYVDDPKKGIFHEKQPVPQNIRIINILNNDRFNIGYPIDKIYTTNNENIWNIRKNSEGELEPFLVGGKKSNVVLTRLDILHKITAEEGGWGGWWHDVFSRKSQEVVDREVKHATITFKVPKTTAYKITRLKVTLENGKIKDYSTNEKSKDYLCPKCIKNLIREGATISGAVEYYDALNKGPYELSAEFPSKFDSTGKSKSGRINKELNIITADALGASRTKIKNIINILNRDVGDSYAKEKALVNLVKQNKNTPNVFFQDLIVDLVMKTPDRDLVQLSVDFASEGYTSYGDIRDDNLKKISNILDFVGTSLKHLQTEYYGGLAQDRTITLVKKENNNLFLRDSYGNTLPIDSEIEPFVARLIPLLTSQAIKKSQNQVLNQKNYKFPKFGRLYTIWDPEKKEVTFSPTPP